MSADRYSWEPLTEPSSSEAVRLLIEEDTSDVVGETELVPPHGWWRTTAYVGRESVSLGVFATLTRAKTAVLVRRGNLPGVSVPEPLRGWVWARREGTW